MSEAPKRRWFQFEMIDLILGTTLVAVGLGILLASLRNSFHLDYETAEGHITLIGLAFASGAMIGAGLLSPFKLKTVGLILGFVLVFPAVFFFERF